MGGATLEKIVNFVWAQKVATEADVGTIFGPQTPKSSEESSFSGAKTAKFGQTSFFVVFYICLRKVFFEKS